ncbi:sulfotransferase [Candidatus Pelagisphaera phototrophica]|uniref:sulfotransferase n=1 Tax=Candidatus Pelagisphaera phototrophica TaxID=2684113 RepID=UPI001A0540E9|nr:sulfotransferase [Candidatus Pelagisphaera phototrophica]QXD33626.1 sulfotransferase [Candidatus Pelagisphaera phototrophica]
MTKPFRQAEWWQESHLDNLNEKIIQLRYWLGRKPLLKDLVGQQDPVIIAGQGGSGTRLAAQIFQKTSSFGLLYSSRKTLDSFSQRRSGLNDFNLMAELVKNTHTVNYDPMNVETTLRKKIESCCEQLIKNICSEKRAPRIWGWKEPYNLFWMPFMYKFFPKLKFILIVRDVRGIRQMHIQGREELYDAYFEKNSELDQRGRFEMLWAAQYKDILDWSEKHLGQNYKIVKTEDLTGNNNYETIKEMLSFAGIHDANVSKLTQLARPLREFQKVPRSGLVQEVLNKFGY